MAGSNYGTQIKTDIVMCLKYDEGGICMGAGGRRLRRICIYCPNYEQNVRTEPAETPKDLGRSEEDAIIRGNQTGADV